MTKNMKKKPLSSSVQMGVIALLVPIAITVYVLAFFCLEGASNTTDI